MGFVSFVGCASVMVEVGAMFRMLEVGVVVGDDIVNIAWNQILK